MHAPTFRHAAVGSCWRSSALRHSAWGTARRLGPQVLNEHSRRGLLLAGGGLAAVSTHSPARAASGDNGAAMSTDALKQAVRDIVPQLTGDRAKGQAGKIAVIGGCREYTGAPYFAAISALKIGADLSHVFCTDGAATVIKGYSPELIVHPYLPDSHDHPDRPAAEQVRQAVRSIDHWMDRFDAVVIGPGLGRDELVHETVKQVMQKLREKRKPLVIDADGLYICTKTLDLIGGYDLALLTPNKREFERLADRLGVALEGSGAPADPLAEVARQLQGPVVLRKGSEDRVCDGARVIMNAEAGSKRRAGGQGDVLAGALAVMTAWAQEYTALPYGKRPFPEGVSPLMVAAYGASLVARHAQASAFARKGRSMLAQDVIDELGGTVDALFDKR